MSLNVLVVDDSAVMRSMIIRTLEMAGVDIGQVFQASNGEEALQQLDANWIDLALVDINMPVMNGEQLIEEVRRRSAIADLPIIVVSTEGSQTRIERLQQKGAKFIHKPFTPETIGQIVEGVTEVANDNQV
ncbi:MAG TPA: response regulator [Phycisphaerae bacterium]|nr:response regulator [Phycisphaerae bacterium]HOI56777.1 response regulator [Phycisphaerae bacterium]